MAIATDIIGKRFGKLTVLRRGENNSRGEARWVCKCDCGRETLVITNNLNCGNTRSCGCTRVEKLNRFSYKHGACHRGKKERLYLVWRNMVGRCYDESNSEYKRYGARGIEMCEEWKDSYAAFREWAMSTGYNPLAKKGECTIERVDNDGNYCPENCIWTNLKRQANNKRNNHYLNVLGKKITTAEASEKYGIPYRRLLKRLNSGWSDEDAVLTGKRVNQWG